MRKIALLCSALMLCGAFLFAQEKVVTGRVTDEKGEPIPFATILVKGSKKGASADADGKFAIKADQGSVLVASAQGMEPKEIKIGSENTVTFNLKTTTSSLQEVVVTTAFGVKKEQRTTPFSAQVVKSDALTIIPQTNINDALAGKIAGVQFRTQSGTKLNSQSFARVRGGLSLAGDVGPIYVVDGTIVGDNGMDIDPESVESVTFLKGANATALFGGRAINGALVITSKKGTNSKGTIKLSQGTMFDRPTRLMHLQNTYAGGGVDHLTTYHYNAGNDPVEWQALDGKQFPDYTDDASWGPKMEGQEYIPWYAWVPGTKYSFKTASLTPQPDNIKDFWETGVTNNTNISFTKGGQGYSTRLSYTKQDIKGLIPNSGSDRNILSTVTTVDLNKFITAGVDLTYNTQKIHGEFDDGYANQSSGNFGQWNHRDLDMKIMKELRGLKTPAGTLASWNWAHNPDGYDASDPAAFYSGNYWYNFYSYMDNLDYEKRRDRIFGDAYIKVNLPGGFGLKGTVRKDQISLWEENRVKSILEQSASQTGLLASYYTNEQYKNEMTYEGIITYNHTFFKDLAVNVLAGGAVNTYTEKNNNASTVNGLIIPDFYAIANSKSQPSIGNFRQQSKTNSIFASGDFEYRKFISATWAVRQDWSSTLPENNNKLFYPSVGAAFVPSEILHLPSAVSFIKLYGSWGKKPLSLNIYDNFFGYGIGQYQWNGNYLMSTPNAVPDAALKGSLITSYEAGLELRFLKNRFGFNVNYYNEKSENQPVAITIDGVSGYTSKTINAATVERHGFEFTLNGTIVKTRDFTWSATKTLGWLVKNPVTKIVEGQDRIQPSNPSGDPNFNWIGAVFSGGALRYASAYQVLNKDWGQLIGGGYKTGDGGKPLVDPATGLYVGSDPDKDWGSIVPKITGGFQNLFTYKNFLLNVSFDYQFGGKFFSLTESWGMYSGLLDYTASTNDRGANVRDATANGGGVHVTGVSSVDSKTPIDMYVDGYTYFHQFASGSGLAVPFIHDLSYVKLREVSLGYNVPVRSIGTMSKWIQGATVSLIARNPWLIYSASRNFDPSEISSVFGENGQLPSVRSMGVNVTLTF
ncbi:MAG: SusC/RagA family TonB-linked outer membrane protein [Chitinophagaceae bacterium]